MQINQTSILKSIKKWQQLSKQSPIDMGNMVHMATRQEWSSYKNNNLGVEFTEEELNNVKDDGFIKTISIGGYNIDCYLSKFTLTK